jgi:recombinational DNA repair protein (RecF pathway)
VIPVSDRKYRHRGYQDSGSRSNEPRPESPRPEPQRQRLEGAPRGRTAGGFGPEAFKCNRCGELRHGLTELTSEELCTKCGADMHTCGNCRFFDTTTLWECRENITARVSAKHSRNECTMFQPKIVRDLSADKAKVATPDDARKAFDALFKK